MSDMPREIWAVPYEDMGHGEWDECAWEPCPFVENQKRPKYETPYIHRPVTKEEAREALEDVVKAADSGQPIWPDLGPACVKHLETIRKLLEAAI